MSLEFDGTANKNDLFITRITIDLGVEDFNLFSHFFLKETEEGKRYCKAAFMQVQCLLFAVSFPFMWINSLGLFVLLMLELQLLIRAKGHPVLKAGKDSHSALSSQLLIPRDENTKRVITLHQKGVEYRIDSRIVFYSFSFVQKLFTTEEAIYIIITRSLPIIIPKRSFQNDEQCDKFIKKIVEESQGVQP